METNLKNKKKLFLSLGLALVVALAIIIGSRFLLQGIGLRETIKSNDILSELFDTFKRIALSVSILLVVKKIYDIKMGFTDKNLGKGLFIHGFLILLYTGLQFYSEYTKPEKSLLSVLPIVAIYLVANLCTGLFEEILCRGLLFNSFKEYFGDNKKGVFKAAFISSALFGAFHLLNLTGHPEYVVGTLTQVAYAFVFGIAFCAIYYLSGNIVSCIILHGIFDFSHDFWHLFIVERAESIEATKAVDMTLGQSATLLLIFVPMLICGLIQLRMAFKKKESVRALAH